MERSVVDGYSVNVYSSFHKILSGSSAQAMWGSDLISHRTGGLGLPEAPTEIDQSRHDHSDCYGLVGRVATACVITASNNIVAFQISALLEQSASQYSDIC